MAIGDWEDGASIKDTGRRGFVGKARVLLKMSIRPPNDHAGAGESGAQGEARDSNLGAYDKLHLNTLTSN